MESSKRIKKLKRELIKELPFFPNVRETQEELEQQNLSGVMIHYLHWQTRLVPARKRKIQIAPEVTSDKRWKLLKEGINGLCDKFRNGDDVKPYLSKRAHNYAYTPVQRIKDGDANAWEDKDQILNTKGFHHFHLNMNVQHTGLSERTDDVLFAFVTRDKFHAVAIFDHSVFEPADSNGDMGEERTRMWELHEKHITLGMEAGSAYFSNIIMSSGHPMYLIRLSDHYTRIIEDTDDKLDDRVFINGLYDQGKLTPPCKFNFEWHIKGLDLGIFDKRSNVYFSINEGHL